MLSSLLQGWGWVGTTSHVGAGLLCPTLSLLLPLRRGPSFLPLVTANGCLGRWCSSHGMMGGVSPFIPVWSMRRPLLSEALLCPRGGCRGHQGWGSALQGQQSARRTQRARRLYRARSRLGKAGAGALGTALPRRGSEHPLGWGSGVQPWRELKKEHSRRDDGSTEQGRSFRRARTVRGGVL